MFKKRKKNSRQRGGKTHGWGAKKKHRGGGSRGGRGYGGSKKHKRSYIYKYKPNHFGGKGFYSLHKKPKSINLEDLSSLKTSGSIDLTKMGYGKLLGKGDVSSSLVITVDSASSSAVEKVEKAGGKVIVKEAMSDAKSSDKSGKETQEKKDKSKDTSEPKVQPSRSDAKKK